MSYLQIPATNTRASGEFYARVFGWQVRGGRDEQLSFTDATGDLIGAWVTSRVVNREPGVVPYIYVHGLDATLDLARAAGAELIRAPYPEGDLWVATIRDPAGNEIGVWQQGPR
jgi:predicted enzyme related to lactoylglutathione lyase